MSELTKIQNIGAELARRMKLAGINSLDDLKELGSEEAWLRIREHTPQACINNLMALEGAIQGIRWHNLDQVYKNSLRTFYNEQSL